MAELEKLKRVLAETLVKSRLDYTDDLLVLTALLTDFRWRGGHSAEDAASWWRVFLARPLPPGHFLELYLHFPYCRSRCLFCFTDARVPSSPEAPRRYPSELEAEMRWFAPLFTGRTFRSFMVGGGTPSLLSAGELDEVLGLASRLFSMEEGGIRSIEFNPASTEPEKLEACARAGMNRVSFGVQSFNAKVLRAVQREEQDLAMTQDAVAWARRAGISHVNLDLVFGLLDEPLESILESFDLAASLEPTTIMISALSVTDSYLRLTKTTRERHFAHYESILAPGVAGLAEIAARRGYDPNGLDARSGLWTFTHRSVSAAQRKSWKLSDPGARPSSTLGLGPHSRSRLFGSMVCERSADGFRLGAPLYRAAPITLKEEMASHVWGALEHGSRLDFSKFRGHFGRDAREVFSLELKALRALGKIRIDAEGFSFLPVRLPERDLYGLIFLLDSVVCPPNGETADPGFLERLALELSEVALEAAA